MIVEGIFDLLTLLITTVFSLVPDLPGVPDKIVTTISNFLDLIFNEGISLLSLFVNVDTLLVIAPLGIIIYNADKLLAIISWILRKMPFSIT